MQSSHVEVAFLLSSHNKSDLLADKSFRIEFEAMWMNKRIEMKWDYNDGCNVSTHAVQNFLHLRMCLRYENDFLNQHIKAMKNISRLWQVVLTNTVMVMYIIYNICAMNYKYNPRCEVPIHNFTIPRYLLYFIHDSTEWVTKNQILCSIWESKFIPSL